jgi:hypothetical protein
MVKLHCGALKCTNLETAAEVIGMECFFQIKSEGGMVAQTNRSRLNGKQHRSIDAIIPTERARFHPKERLKQQISLLCTDMYQSSDRCKGDGNGRVFFRIRSVGGMVARTNRSILTQ